MNENKKFLTVYVLGLIFIIAGVLLLFKTATVITKENKKLKSEIEVLTKDNKELKMKYEYEKKAKEYWYYYNVDDAC